MCATPVDHEKFSETDIQRRILTEGNNQLPTHGLLDYCIHVRQVGAVVEVRKAIRPDDGINFRLCLSLSFWMHGHGQKESFSA